MGSSFWHKLRSRNLAPSRGQGLRGGSRLFYRPRLEPLENRLAPAGIPALPGAGGKPPQGAAQIQVTVEQDSAETVIDLGATFGARSGIQHGGGLKLSILGNTNSGLVTTDLSEAALTLTYAQGKFGTATIMVGATDADGVSVTQSLLVTVRSSSQAHVALVTPVPVRLAAPTSPLPSR